MIGRIWRKLTRDQRGVTLTELTVTVTIIGILGAVVATGVSGSTTGANESSRAQLFSAVQGAVDAFAQNHLPPDGNLTKATYPYSRGTTSATAATVQFTTTGKPAETDGVSETRSWDWYAASGKFLSPQPGTTTAGVLNTPASTGVTAISDFFVYVDLYTGGATCTETSGAAYGATSDPTLKTDIRCLGFLKLPGGAAKAFGTPGTAGKVIRCLFVSNSDSGLITDQNSGVSVTVFAEVSSGTVTEIKGGATAAAATAAVGATKGRVLACRDQDPGGTKTG